MGLWLSPTLPASQKRPLATGPCCGEQGAPLRLPRESDGCQAQSVLAVPSLVGSLEREPASGLTAGYRA